MFRPSMQVPWWAAKAVRAAAVPLLFATAFWRVYMETWNDVWRKPK